MANITKDKFLRFRKLQNSGVINMTDIVRGAQLAHITEDEYEEIMWNYSKYKEEFFSKPAGPSKPSVPGTVKPLS
jgi:hypothetical protein